MFDYGIPFADINRNMAALAAPPVNAETLVRPPRVAPGASYELSVVHAPIIAPLSRNSLGGFHRFQRVRHLRHRRIPIQIQQISDVRFADAQHIRQVGLRHAALAHLGVQRELGGLQGRDGYQRLPISRTAWGWDVQVTVT